MSYEELTLDDLENIWQALYSKNANECRASSKDNRYRLTLSKVNYLINMKTGRHSCDCGKAGHSINHHNQNTCKLFKTS